MTRRTTRTAAALAGAAAAASGAYALGTQADDGSALAGGTRGASSAVAVGYGGSGPGGPRLNGLADELGVSEARLREALEKVRPERKRPQREDHAADLAAALGVSEAKVREAFEQVGADRHAGIARALAEALDKPVADVRPALEKAHDAAHADGARRGDRDALLSTLASELNVSRDKVASALRSLRREGRPRRGRGPDGAALAKALGVTQAELRAAMGKLHTERRNAFADALAAELNIDKAKVREALEDFGPPGPGGPGHRHHHGGPPPGGPPLGGPPPGGP